MAYDISSILNSRMRISGISSGLDVDGIVQQLMRIERMKVDQAKQSKTLLEWKRDDYRSIMNSIRAFKDEYFDVLKPATNMRSASSLSALKTTYNGADTSSYFTAAAGSSATQGTFLISNVQLAKAAKAASSGSVTGNMAGSAIDFGSTVISAENNNNKISVVFNGVTKEITLNDGISDIGSLVSNLNEKLESAFGAGKITVGAEGGSITFNTASTNVLNIGGVADNGGLEAIGYLNANKSNKLSLSSKLSDIAGFFSLADLEPADGDGDEYDIEFVINGKEFQFKSSQTLSEIISTVNGDAEAGVKMSYDQLNDKIVVQSKTVGAVSRIQIEDVSGNGNLMAVLGLAGADAAGTDASITYDDGSGAQVITRASNDFAINGVAFSLKKEYSAAVGDPIEVKLEGDPEKTLELVKGFINKYNELLDKINGELNEKVYKDFPPLTEEQRAEMSDKEIELWEEKAKSGMLNSDGILSSFLNDMRNMLYKEVDGVSAKLYSIGITTGTWEQKGKLVLNETKLKEAIINSPDEVIKLFTQESDIRYSPDMSAEERAARNRENGIANRLYDVIQDYTRTSRNNEGRKGILLEKAGIIGDVTENGSLLSKEIQAKDQIINTLLDKLLDKENQYYRKFTAMESALNQMNSQIMWLSQQMGTGV